MAPLSHDSANSISSAANDPSAAIKGGDGVHTDARGASEPAPAQEPNGVTNGYGGPSCPLLASTHTAKPDWLGVFAVLFLASYAGFSLVFCSWLSLVVNGTLAAALCYVAPAATGIARLSRLQLKASSLLHELAIEKCRVASLSSELSQKDSKISVLAQKVVNHGTKLMESSEKVQDLEKQLDMVDETLLRARLAALVQIVSLKAGLNLEFKDVVGKGGFSKTVLATMATPTSRTRTEVVLKIANGSNERRAIKEEASKLAFLNSLPGSGKHVIKLVHDKCITFKYSGEAAAGSESLYSVIIIEKAGANLAKHFDDNALASPRPCLGFVNKGSPAPDDALSSARSCPGFVNKGSPAPEDALTSPSPYLGSVNKGSPAPEDTPNKLLQVATLFRSWDSTLTWLHSHGIAHLDIKPENVVIAAEAASMLPAAIKAVTQATQLVPAAAEVKLIDFAGMCLPATARAAPVPILSAGQSTANAALCWDMNDGQHGTVHTTEKYTQPEQFRPGAATKDADDETWLVDCTYDRWSLGMSMLTLICPKGSSGPAEDNGPDATGLSPILNGLSSRTCSPEELGQLVSISVSSGSLARDLRQSVASQARSLNDGFLVDYIARIVERNISQGMGLMRSG